jgi:Raf kinase inhibitor-like YbhB/YbcL family protein
MEEHLRLTPLFAALTLLVGCKATSAGLMPSAAPGIERIESLTVTSKAFGSKAPIPIDYSCDGSNKSPPLTWSAPPEKTQSIAIVVEDPDAPGGVYTHWIVYDLPPSTLSLAEGFDPASVNARIGVNDARNVGYDGPCPPRREIHQYVFRVFAVDTMLNLREGITHDQLYDALHAHLLGEGFLVGTFAR